MSSLSSASAPAPLPVPDSVSDSLVDSSRFVSSNLPNSLSSLSEAVTAAVSSSPSTPISCLLIYNISKRQNIGSMVRSAVGLGCSFVLIVGLRQIALHGNKGAEKYIRFVHFDRIDDAVAALKSHSFSLIGVEISSVAMNLMRTPGDQLFSARSCFCLGNEGSGLNAKMKSHCDKFIYIPQYGSGTASLNVATSCAILLLHFSSWAGKAETKIDGEKFFVDENAPIFQNNPKNIAHSQSMDKTKEFVNKRKMVNQQEKEKEMGNKGKIAKEEEINREQTEQEEAAEQENNAQDMEAE